MVNVGKYTSPMDGMGCLLNNSLGLPPTQDASHNQGS